MRGHAGRATHRAMDDTKVTQAAFLRLFEMARQLPVNLTAEIVRLSESIDWDGSYVFEHVLQERLKEGIQAKQGRKDKGIWFDQSRFPPLENPEQPYALDCEEVASLLEYGGPFSKYFEAYEHRPEQVEMLKAVTTALSEGNHLMVEAGTGVGKSFAYLIPAALFAVQNNTRVVISTNTINLQDQLIEKDIPDLRAALNLDVRAAVLKGRSNYLCPRRLDNLKHYGPRNADEMRVLAKILVWQSTDQSGDRNSLNLNGNPERDVWLRLSAEDDACTAETCLKRTGGACPFHRARMAAQSAHLLVVNHALLLSDIATGNKVLPEYSRLIIDEGHHVESATTNALSFRLTQFELERLLKDLGGPNAGILGRVLSDTRAGLRPSAVGFLQQQVDRATDMAFRLEQLNREFFDTLSAFAALQREDQPQRNYSWQARILPATRALPGWDQVEITWDAAAEALSSLLKTLAEIHRAGSELYAEGHEELEDVLGDISNVYRRLSEAEANLSGMITNPANDQVYWIEVNPTGNRLSLNAAPLRVGTLIEKYLWHEKASVVVTSATLTAHGEFQYLRNTLGADEADELQLGSPFDYETSTLLYVANDLPDEVVDTLLAVCRQNAGLFQHFFRLKQRFLGLQAMRGYDIYAPLADSDKRFSYADAIRMVTDSYAAFSPEVAALVQRVFDANHLDAEIRKGKIGGAFCYAALPELTPWVLSNYSGRAHDVAVLAHELGHAVHSMLSGGHSVLSQQPSLPLAETASVFGEMLLTDRLLRKEQDRSVRREILAHALDDAYLTVLRQAYITIFEKDAHAMVAAGCSVEELAEHYLANLREQLGDAVQVGDEFRWAWTGIPHLYEVPFYTYAYSFGQLLVLALYQQYQREDQAFVPRYLRLLSYGGSEAPVKVLSEAGFDIASTDFWQGGFDFLNKMLGELEQSF